MSGVAFYPYDIETVANERARAYFAKKVYEAPSNWKDKVKIEQYQIEARHKDQQKAALSWWTGKIVCINLQSLEDPKLDKTFVGADEAKLLNAFFTYLSKLSKFTLIGKSSKYFDNPYLVGRCIALDIGVPDFLRPYRQIEDIDEVFGFGSRADQASSLADYAAGMGIDGKSGHGSDVQHWHDAAVTGQDAEGWKKIAAYCSQDNAIVKEFLRRYTKQWVPQGAPGPVQPRKPDVVDGIEIPFQPSTTAPVKDTVTEVVKAEERLKAAIEFVTARGGAPMTILGVNPHNFIDEGNAMKMNSAALTLETWSSGQKAEPAKKAKPKKDEPKPEPAPVKPEVTSPLAQMEFE